MRTHMKVLNLYAGIGGNRKLWEDVEVTAVEMNEEIAEAYQELFPNDTVIVGDAHSFLLENFEGFDFIWSSPPCQSHSKMARVNHVRYGHRRYPDMSLYQEIIFLQAYAKDRVFVVENVKPYYEVLIPAQECERHLFWTNFKVHPFRGKPIENFLEATSTALKEWLGYSDFKKQIYVNDNNDPCQVLRNCVHPELGLHILNCAHGKQMSYAKQTPLFN